jgi:hypothetical protein
MSLKLKAACGLVLAAAILTALFGPAILRGWLSVYWARVPGTIDSVEVKEGASDPPDWRVPLRYHFVLDERRFEGSRFTSTGEFYGDERAARDFAANHRIGRTVDVFYDPTDPSDCVLQAGMDYRHWCVLGMILVVWCVAAILAIPEIVRSRRQRSAASAREET